MQRSHLVLEGGALESNGTGTLLAVEPSIVDPRRNPRLERTHVEHVLDETLGIRRVHWLTPGQLPGDDTDGHIDTMARFTGPDHICHITEDDPGHPDFDVLRSLRQQLQALRGPQGTPYRLTPLPHPRPIYRDDGSLQPATYANFLIINGAVLVPTYAQPDRDRLACERLAACFPNRRILPLDSRALIRQAGSLHCATMQIAGFTFLFERVSVAASHLCAGRQPSSAAVGKRHRWAT